MKKSISNLGKVLNKEAQKNINGALISRCGRYIGDTGETCISHSDCSSGSVCHNRCCNTAV